MNENKRYNNIDEYINQFSGEVKERLQQIRKAIAETAPEATEKISYQMPTFYLNGNLVHFAAFKNHIGFYPTPNGIEEFEEELSKCKGGKGSVQFPFNEPLPLDLIKRIVKYRVSKNEEKR
jgi:uncharacterized protein YdhG (YjbR/CyaY superfamily)